MTDVAIPGRQRAEAYWFLASLFGHPMDSTSLERIASLSAAIQPENAGIAADLHAALVNEEDNEELVDRLAAEHARLFLGLREGHGPPPPYESLWREGRVAGDSTLAVAKAYSDAGFDDKGPWGPCDHIAYELRFMASLCHAQDEAQNTKSGDEAEWAHDLQIRFVDEHLLAWVPEYCQQISEQTQESLYRALARVTKRVIAEDAQYLHATRAGNGADPVPSTATGAEKGVGT